jgi:hypothetical protein
MGVSINKMNTLFSSSNTLLAVSDGSRFSIFVTDRSKRVLVLDALVLQVLWFYSDIRIKSYLVILFILRGRKYGKQKCFDSCHL